MARLEILSGKAHRFPDGTTDEQVARYAQKNGLRWSKSPTADGPMEGRELWANRLRAVGQGALFGFGDEVEAAARTALTDQTYDDAVGGIRQSYGRYAKENPGEALSAELAGGVGGAFLAPGIGAATGLTRTAGALGSKLLPKLAAKYATSPTTRMVTEGAAAGGASGVGSGEGDLLQRLDDGLGGMATGAAFGTLLPSLGRAGGKLYQSGRDLVRPSKTAIKRKAAAYVAKKMGQDSLDGPAITAQMAADRAAGIPSTLGMQGRNLRGATEAMAGRQGRGPGEMVETLEGQQQGLRDRLSGRIKGALGGDSYYATMEALNRRLRGNASKAYDEAYAVGTVDDPKINELLKTPQFAKFWQQAKRVADAEALAASARGEDPTPYQLEQIYKMETDADGNITGFALEKLPDVRTLDWLRRGMTAAIDNAYSSSSGISKAEANAMKDLRKAFTERLDTLVPEYGAARRIYAGDMETRDALEFGLDDFMTLEPDEAAARLKGMSDAEKAAVRVGVARRLLKPIGDNANEQNWARRAKGGPDNMKRLSMLFDDPGQAQVFEAALKREAELYAQRARALGGSPTAPRQQAQAEFDETVSSPLVDMADVATNPTPGNVLQRLMRLMERKTPMPEEVANEVSKILKAGSPEEVDEALAMLEKYGAEIERLNAASASRGALAARTIGAASGEPPDPREEAIGVRLGTSGNFQ